MFLLVCFVCTECAHESGMVGVKDAYHPASQWLMARLLDHPFLSGLSKT